ncbi:hypothetical protein ccbrp13_61090 [Ktedonobacteria bacterium brp13]|nr:hypothetical protein ccbrp13_61090 [Ktedonobacteria bacterium brp13]
MQTTDAGRFLEYIGVTLHFEAQDDVADLVQVSGCHDPYKATFCRDSTPTQQKEVREVIVFLSNTREQPTTSLHILVAVSQALSALEEVSSFSAWCVSLKKHPTSYDARQVEAGRHVYLWRRYCYLRATKHDLQTFFPEEQFALLCDFWLRFVCNDWPW